MSDPRAAYDRQARYLAGLYESLSCAEDCHRDMLDLVPDRSGLVLDVEAGSRSVAGMSWRSSPRKVSDAKPSKCIRKAPIRWLEAQEV